MADVIKNYIRNVIFETNGVGVLPHWASCPTLPYTQGEYISNYHSIIVYYIFQIRYISNTAFYLQYCIS